jgi:hypothetical protein
METTPSHSSQFAAMSDIGRRLTMQDFYLVDENLCEINGFSARLYAVFDGHGINLNQIIIIGSDGHKTGTFVKENLSAEIRKVKDEILTNPKGTFKNIFQSLHSMLLEDESIDSYLSGTTCALALFVGRTVYVANVGDSRIVLFKTNPTKGRQITMLIILIVVIIPVMLSSRRKGWLLKGLASRRFVMKTKKSLMVLNFNIRSFENIQGIFAIPGVYLN